MKRLTTQMIVAGMCMATFATTAAMAASQVPAFPGAQGWGRWAKGARAASTPTVYHVTNLNDAGAGSLRDAVSQPGRIVVFDVSGVIRLSSRVVFASNLYVAGQTAPGEGITVYGNGVSFSGASNIICRYLRIRMGHHGDSGKDCAGIANGTNMIFDHCSFSWGLDETFSINPDGKGALHNITLMNCIFGQGLMTHSAGGLMQADSITLYRNLYCDNSTRNNKVKGTNQYANNIVYNWSNGCYIMGGDSEGTSYVNIESNLFINGPSKGGAAFTGANGGFHCYGVDNWQDSNRDGVFDPYEVTDYSASDHRSTDPYDYPELDLWPGHDLLTLSLPTVGASLPYRDQSDCYMVDEVLSLGRLGALISNEENLPIGAPSTWAWWTGQKVQDTDGDGMPDAWETAHGTDPTRADATAVGADGYLNIERYLNGITAEDRQYFLRRPITLGATATTSTLTLTWRDYTYDEEGFAIEYRPASTSAADPYTEAGRTAPGATAFTLTGLTDGTAYDVRVRAFGHDGAAEAWSEWATATVKTRPVEVGVVDIDTYEPTVTNSTDVAEGDRLLLTTDTELDYTLAAPISPASVVATGSGTITVGGAAIGGTGTSVNKGGAGTLVMDYTANTYTGATVLHDGVLAFASIAPGGQPSAIGASQEFAQNWIMDGGTYRYTGGNASTNRSARLTAPTTLELASGSTLTMTGAIEGDGDFTLDGSGQLTVGSTGLFAYTGTTTLRGGTLWLSTVDIAKAGIGQSKRLVMAGGTLRTAGESSNYETYSFDIEVAENTVSRFAPNRNCYMRSKLTGAGTLQIDIPYLREYFACDLSGFTGQIVANGTNSKDGSLFLAEKHFDMPQTRVRLTGAGKTYMCAWETNATNRVGGLSGDRGTYLIGSSKNTKGFQCHWIVGGAGSDETFDGIITNLPAGLNKAYAGTVSITKVGTGLWRLGGDNDYSGATAVDGGTLIINGRHSGTGGITVAADATLRGSGTVTGGTVTVAAGATIAAGDTLVDGSTFDLSGARLKLASGAVMEVPVAYYGAAVRTDRFALGTVELGEGAQLRLDLSSAEGLLPVDATLTIFASVGTFAGTFAEVIPATPGEGLKWDLSRLYVEGKIAVRDESFDEGAVSYREGSWFDDDAVDDAGWYWFDPDHAAQTDHLVESGAIAFDAGGKASSAPTYTNEASTHTGGLKMSGKTSEVVFASSGKFMSARFDCFRAGTAALSGEILASEDGETYVKIADIAGNAKEETFVDCTSALTGHDYHYLKLTNSTTAVMYVQGASITCERMFTGLPEVSTDAADAPAFDLGGRNSAPVRGQLYIQDGRKRVRY